VYHGIPLSCVLLTVFRRNAYFFDGALIISIRFTSVCGLLIHIYVYPMKALCGRNLTLNSNDGMGYVVIQQVTCEAAVKTVLSMYMSCNRPWRPIEL
jgi:hypothetical protein